MTKYTMSWLLWSDAVLTGAGVTFEDSKPYRDRMQRAYQAGETVDVSAHMLRSAVKRGAPRPSVPLPSALNDRVRDVARQLAKSGVTIDWSRPRVSLRRNAATLSEALEVGVILGAALALGLTPEDVLVGCLGRLTLGDVP